MNKLQKLLVTGYWLLVTIFGVLLLAPQTSDAAQFCCSCRNAFGCTAGIPAVLTAANQSAADTLCRAACSPTGDASCVAGVTAGACTAAASGGGGALVGFGNPLCPNSSRPCDIPTITGNIIRAALGIVGTVALVMFIYGGFIWMVGGQRGSEKKVRYAKEVLVWSTLGMLVIFASYIIVNFIIKQLTE